MIRRMILAAALAVSSIAQPAIAQDSLATSIAPAPTQIRLPLVRLIMDGDRVVMQVVGSTLAPAGTVDGHYVGPDGYTSDIAQATDIRGAAAGTSIANPTPGPPGAPGKSAYQAWVDQGHEGTEADFVAALRGQQGIPGGPGPAGTPGQDGRSAYQVWLDAGNSGSPTAFLASLIGGRGTDGTNGLNGKDGADGAASELRVSGGFIQWRAGSGAWANLIATADLIGPRGGDGAPGANGTDGQPGTAASVTIGAVTTGAPGSAAIVTNSGSPSAAIFNFTVPAGQPGSNGGTGATGATPNLQIGTIATLAPGSSATAGMRGTAANPLLDLGLPAGVQGIQGVVGPAGPTGQTGATGATPQLGIGTVSTLPAGSAATATIAGTLTAPTLNLGLPAGAVGATGATGGKGDTGATGSAGAAATIAIGTVTPLAAGSTPTVTNSGTSSAAVLNFGLPRSALYLTDVTLAQSTLIALNAGPRTLSVATNCVVGDRLVMHPVAAMPQGYMLGDMFCSANGTAQATLYAPLLAIGANYSIAVRVTAFR